ncbi:MAG: hypothetical protein K0S65_2475, partial [Labilithrix sp.]|nr:hypothetical protein [Labilithrix sp.]
MPPLNASPSARDVTRALLRAGVAGLTLTTVSCAGPAKVETVVSHARDGNSADVAASALAEHAVAALGGAVELRVRASSPPRVHEGTDDQGARTDFEADLGAGEELVCTVMSGWTGLAHGIEDHIARHRYEMLDRPHIEVDAVAGRPLLLFDLQSYSEEARGPMIRYG